MAMLQTFLCIFIHHYTGVEFKSNQQYEGIDLNPDHHHDQCTDRAIYFIVSAKIIDKITEPKGCYQGHKRRDDRPHIDKGNSPVHRWTKMVNQTDAGIDQKDGEEPR